LRPSERSSGSNETRGHKPQFSGHTHSGLPITGKSNNNTEELDQVF